MGKQRQERLLLLLLHLSWIVEDLQAFSIHSQFGARTSSCFRPSFLFATCEDSVVPPGRVKDIDQWVQWSSDSLQACRGISLLEYIGVDSVSSVHTNNRFAVVSHGTQPDPIFCYANTATLQTFQYEQEEFFQLPSRKSAPTGVERSSRQEIMNDYKQNCVWDIDSGIRQRKDGSLFEFRDVILWNVYNDKQERVGQSAVYDTKKITDVVVETRNSGVRVAAMFGISETERSALLNVIRTATAGNVLFDASLEDTEFHPALVVPEYPGLIGRIMLLESTFEESQGEPQELVATFSTAIDEIVYGGEINEPSQPVLIFVKHKDQEDNLSKSAKEMLRTHVEEYDLATPIGTKNATAPLVRVPTMRIELDGAMVAQLPEKSDEIWDTSSVVIFDGLVGDGLRRRLLSVVLGDNHDKWNDMEQGPDPSRWIKGGLVDTPETQDAGFGLSNEGIEELCFSQHEAIDEFQSILAQILPQYRVCRLPEAVMGAQVSPLTANAPVCGNSFSFHIDGDPYLTPPSPWTDAYGRYPNRARGKPRFMSCLVYLNDQWNVENWGAPTRILDVSSDSVYDIDPLPGRVVLMDQDITHTVVAPSKAAGKRPRYSLVWKLILHPRSEGQDMTMLKASDDESIWPKPILLGSANRKLSSIVPRN